MIHKIVDICPFLFKSASEKYKSQEMRDNVVSKDPFMLKYCPDRYKT